MPKLSTSPKKTPKSLNTFKQVVWDFYKKEGRGSLPWRKTKDPYKILVSEIMLQQTQVERVIPKYEEFLTAFPSVEALAKAEVQDMLRLWQGLGYNRRAINLKRAAERVVQEFGGKFPGDLTNLLSLPGIGKATAGDLLAFAWNEPAIVIETNIRTVFIHHFFESQAMVTDKELAILVEETLDKKNPREWYYALMDYGSHLKKSDAQHRALHRKSTSYKKQSTFKGSNRELRSKILKLILDKSRTEAEIIKLLESKAEPVRKNLVALEKEGLIKNVRGKFK